MSESVNRAGIRRAIRRYVEMRETANVEGAVGTVAATEDVPTETVREQLDTMEEHGFVYLVGDRDGDPEVRLP